MDSARERLFLIDNDLDNRPENALNLRFEPKSVVGVCFTACGVQRPVSGYTFFE